MVLTLFVVGRLSTMYHHRINCPKNTEKRKKFKITTTNAAIPNPPRPTKNPKFCLIYKDASKTLLVLRDPLVYRIVS